MRRLVPSSAKGFALEDSVQSLEPRQGSPNFLIWVLIFHIHNMTSLPSVEQIQKVMQENKTNPLVAYYMLTRKLSYEDAVRFYQQERRRCPLDDGLVSDTEMKLLSEVPHDADFYESAMLEPERMYPDSHYAIIRFNFGCSEEEAALIQKEEDRHFHEFDSWRREAEDRHRTELERIFQNIGKAAN